jgi:hypothetical protein
MQIKRPQYTNERVLSILLEIYEMTKETGYINLTKFLREKNISAAFGTVITKGGLLVKLKDNRKNSVDSRSLYKWNVDRPNIYTAQKTIALVREIHATHIKNYKEKSVAEDLQNTTLQIEVVEEQIIEQTLEQNIEQVEQVEQIEQKVVEDKFEKFQKDMEFISEQQALWKEAKKSFFETSDEAITRFPQEVTTEIQKPKERKISVLWGAILIKW